MQNTLVRELRYSFTFLAHSPPPPPINKKGALCLIAFSLFPVRRDATLKVDHVKILRLPQNTSALRVLYVQLHYTVNHIQMDPEVGPYLSHPDDGGKMLLRNVGTFGRRNANEDQQKTVCLINVSCGPTAQRGP